MDYYHGIHRSLRQYKKKAPTVSWVRNILRQPILKEELRLEFPIDIPKKYTPIIKDICKALGVVPLYKLTEHHSGGFWLNCVFVGYKYDLPIVMTLVKKIIDYEYLFRDYFSHELFKASQRTGRNRFKVNRKRATSECINIEVELIHKHVKEILEQSKKYPLVNTKIKHIKDYINIHRIKYPILNLRNYAKVRRAYK